MICESNLLVAQEMLSLESMMTIGSCDSGLAPLGGNGCEYIVITRKLFYHQYFRKVLCYICDTCRNAPQHYWEHLHKISVLLSSIVLVLEQNKKGALVFTFYLLGMFIMTWQFNRPSVEEYTQLKITISRVSI